MGMAPGTKELLFVPEVTHMLEAGEGRGDGREMMPSV